ncbi:hypothetical protein B0H14DRAFT_2558240 [Mycena olivaceomarginata]|nr:hypothetical protein B0H14DRAFT_2558240 [Mycena olivaceomarginata]
MYSCLATPHCLASPQLAQEFDSTLFAALGANTASSSKIIPSSAPTPLGLEPVETDGFTSLMISQFYSGRDEIRSSEDMAHRFNAHGQSADCGQKTPNRRLVILRWYMDDEEPLLELLVGHRMERLSCRERTDGEGEEIYHPIFTARCHRPKGGEKEKKASNDVGKKDMCGPMFGAAVLDMVPRDESGEDNVSRAIQLLPRRRGAGTSSDNMCVPCETERDGGARPLALGAAVSTPYGPVSTASSVLVDAVDGGVSLGCALGHFTSRCLAYGDLGTPSGAIELRRNRREDGRDGGAQRLYEHVSTSGSAAAGGLRPFPLRTCKLRPSTARVRRLMWGTSTWSLRILHGYLELQPLALSRTQQIEDPEPPFAGKWDPTRGGGIAGEDGKGEEQGRVHVHGPAAVGSPADGHRRALSPAVPLRPDRGRWAALVMNREGGAHAICFVPVLMGIDDERGFAEER